MSGPSIGTVPTPVYSLCTVGDLHPRVLCLHVKNTFTHISRSEYHRPRLEVVGTNTVPLQCWRELVGEGLAERSQHKLVSFAHSATSTRRLHRHGQHGKSQVLSRARPDSLPSLSSIQR
jgi:hypothetical protein